MSEFTLLDKLSDVIVSSLKKTKIYEIIDKINKNVCLCIIVSTFFGFTGIVIGYYNFENVKSLKDKIKESEKILQYSININRKQNQFVYNNLIDQLKKEIEISRKLIEQIKETHYKNSEMISLTPAFSPINFVLPIHDDYIVPLKDDELNDECYGYNNIPLNNFKKLTRFNWF
jgi:hypothetical protein